MGSSANTRQQQLLNKMDEYSRDVLSTKTAWVHTHDTLLLVVARSALPFAPLYMNGDLLASLGYRVVISVEAGQTFIFSVASLQRSWTITKQRLRSLSL